MKNNFDLGDYVRQVFDLNKDGKVTLKEFFATLAPKQAIGIALIVVDILAAVGEYRVWDVAMTITHGDYIKSAGFVAVSLVPFYLAQLLWLYPLATGWQQTISVLMLIAALFTSANFGLADLSQTYNVTAISKWVVYLWLAYIVALLLYVMADKNFRLRRAATTARANATHQGDMNRTMSQILADLKESLEAEQELRKQFGDGAVDAHMELLKKAGGVVKSQIKRDNTPRAQPDNTDNTDNSAGRDNHKVPAEEAPANPSFPPRQ